MLFKDILKYLREEKDLSQKELATACNISPTCICQLETGQRNPTGSTLVSLADFFCCSIDYLLGREDDFGNVTVVGVAEPLPPAERELLADFRQLPDELRHRARTYMKKLVELYKEETAPNVTVSAVPPLKKKNTGQFPA